MVTREEWISTAVDALDEVSIDQLKVLGLARRLGVSRSSFYWFFEDPDDLRAELLAIWERNTEAIVERARRPLLGLDQVALLADVGDAADLLQTAREDLEQRRQEVGVAAGVVDVLGEQGTTRPVVALVLLVDRDPEEAIDEVGQAQPVEAQELARDQRVEISSER